MSSTNAAAAAARLATISGHLQAAPKAGDRFEFDYVIVGGGTAGAVLANRLTENKNVSVAVIEGGPSDVGLDVALNLGRWLEMLEGPYDYDYTTTHQPRGNSNIHHSRARMLGGCSSHNTLISFRPLKEDLDWWAQQHNCPAWAASKIQPYGDRLKLNTVPVQGQHRNEITRNWVEATSKAYKAPVIPDFNAAIVHNGGFASGEGNGVGFLSISYDPYNHDRSSASTSYLHPIMPHAGRSARNNLHLFLESWAEKLVFDPSDSTRVSGVEVLTGPQRNRFSVHAKHDVIVCAGAIDSPRLLLHSGIGPADELKKVGVPVKHNLPGVGKHLSDHPESICMWSVGEKDAPRPDETVMTSDAAFFLRVPSEYEPSQELHKNQPNLMAHCYQVVFGMNLEPMGYKLPTYAFCMTPNIPRSQARGEITLASNNPQDKPLIDFKYFEDERRYDERIIVEGIKACRKIAQTEPFKSHLIEEIAPGPKVQTDEEISAFARAAHHTVYHPSGTCRMGTPGAIRRDGVVSAEQGKPDEKVVVDQKDLRVVGLKGLRVCDASVLPVLPTVNPMLTILMVAERAADLIKKDHYPTHNVPLP